MTGLPALWLPILLSAVVVFLVSWLIHTVLPWHKNDFQQIPNQDKVMDAMRPFAIAPGDYMLPRANSMKEMCTPEFVEKLNKGPIAIMTVVPNGPISMGKSLVMWFLYTIVVAIFAAYIAGRALPVGAPYLHVFRFVGCTSFIGYSLALWQSTIWYHRPCLTTFKLNIDGLIYGLLSAGVFGWLWPR
jgi:hypothetical protein